jgi:riboflavin transporter FmnP
MMVANLLITPIYMGVGVEAVKALIPTTLLPFNIAKALMNSALVMLIYKPVVKLTRRIGLAKTKSETKSSGKYFNRDTLTMASIAVVAMIIAIVIFVILRK